MTNQIDDELLTLHSEYLDKVLSFNVAIWSTLITLHGIIISVFALILTINSKIPGMVIYVALPIMLFLSLSSMWVLFKNFVDSREIYGKIADYTRPKKPNPEALKAHKDTAYEKQKTIKGREAFAKYVFYIEFVMLFVVIYCADK